MIPAVVPLVLLGLGIAASIGAVLVLRSFGRGYRIARLLATTPRVTVEEAIGVARSGERRYVRVEGRIDSESEFEDEHHRPLVFRRRRLFLLSGSRWKAIDDQREAVPFAVREALSAIAIDSDALDDGLIVIPREAMGNAADARQFVMASVPDDTAVRMRVDQVSSVEHAIVLGLPIVRGGGDVILGADGDRPADRPLVLTTVEQPEAMRLLAGGRRTRTAVAAALLVGGSVGIVGGVGWAIVGGVR